MSVRLARHGSATAVSLLGAVLVNIACRDSGPTILTLGDLSTPDTNTAVVGLAQTVPGIEIPAGEEAVYVVDPGHVPHVTLARNVIAADTAIVTVVVADLYATGPVVTDGTINRFAWRSPTGSEFTPLTPCTLTVTSAYVLGTPSMQAVETACRVASDGVAITILAKARRYLPLGGSGAGG